MNFKGTYMWLQDLLMIWKESKIMKINGYSWIQIVQTMHQTPNWIELSEAFRVWNSNHKCSIVTPYILVEMPL
jgi:hypothetical protein